MNKLCRNCASKSFNDNTCVQYLGEAIGWQWRPVGKDSYKICYKNHIKIIEEEKDMKDIKDLKKFWKAEFDEKKFKYFVIKAEDVFNFLEEKELNYFNKILAIIEYERLKLNKKSSNNYYVVNRDEDYAEEVKNIIENNCNIKL